MVVLALQKHIIRIIRSALLRVLNGFHFYFMDSICRIKTIVSASIFYKSSNSEYYHKNGSKQFA